MIVEAVFAFVLTLFTGVIQALVPDFVLTGMPDLSGVFEGVATLNAFFPITDMMGVALMLVTVQGAMFFIKLTQTIVAHIPFIGGSGA